MAAVRLLWVLPYIILFETSSTHTRTHARAHARKHDSKGLPPTYNTYYNQTKCHRQPLTPLLISWSKAWMCGWGWGSWFSSVPRDKCQNININYTAPTSFYILFNPLFINYSIIQRYTKLPKASITFEKKIPFYPTLMDFWKKKNVFFRNVPKPSLFCPSLKSSTWMTMNNMEQCPNNTNRGTHTLSKKNLPHCHFVRFKEGHPNIIYKLLSYHTDNMFCPHHVEQFNLLKTKRRLLYLKDSVRTAQ